MAGAGCIAEQNGLCMRQYGRIFGCCLVAASSLVWLGCHHYGPHNSHAETVVHRPAPQAGPSLEILNLPQASPFLRPGETIDTQAPATTILGQLIEQPTANEPADPPLERPRLMPPVLQNLQPPRILEKR
jgi:hypothetical protein